MSDDENLIVSLSKEEKRALKLKKKTARKEEKARQKSETKEKRKCASTDPLHETAKAKPSKKAKAAGGGPASSAAVGDTSLASSLPAIKKNVYTEHPATMALSSSHVEAWRAERQMTLSDNCLLRPILSFQHTCLSRDELIATENFTTPSPIQAQCIPIALSGRDLVGIASTGSGKTLAFGLPALRHIQENTAPGERKQLRVLILAPTRELAVQIQTVLEEAGSKCGVKSVCIYGGVPKRDQIHGLKGASIAVATPGRLEDLMSDGSCSLRNISYLVLDEADRMLDLGFEPAIRKIAGATRADRQTLMFSATWPPAIRSLASEFMASNFVRVTIGNSDCLTAAKSVKQVIEVVEGGSRDDRLHHLLVKYHGKTRANRVLIFVLYKKEAVRVEERLRRQGWEVAAVHGDLSQGQRSAAVEGFKAGQTPLLVATDVAARGLDIPDVEVVINYSFPLTTEDYVHRIGRTGRAGKSGISHTFFVGQNDKPRAGELINVLKDAGQPVPEELLKFGTAVKKKESKLYGAHFKEVDHTAKATKVTFDSDSE